MEKVLILVRKVGLLTEDIFESRSLEERIYIVTDRLPDLRTILNIPALNRAA